MLTQSRSVAVPAQSVEVPSSSSWFGHVDAAPADPILGVTIRFKEDRNPNKMNLGVGAWRDDEGKPEVLRALRKAELEVAGELDMEYLPTEGLSPLRRGHLHVTYGAHQGEKLWESGNTAVLQALSGTGALRLFAEFMARYLPGARVYIPDPSWSNHHNIFRDAGVERVLYRYYKNDTRGLDFEGMTEDLAAAPEGSVVLLHACAHNPTGVDPSPEQWAQLSALCAQRHLLPLFDSAYQGFASGDFDADAFGIRKFFADGHRPVVAQSFAKNMGLYGQRTGALSVVCDNAHDAQAVQSQIKAVARAIYSSPPLHGALLASRLIWGEELNAEWKQEVKSWADAIAGRRHALRHALEALGSPHSWRHMTAQIGMFCYSGLTKEQCARLEREYSIYLTSNGRISMAGFSEHKAPQLAEAIHAVTK